MYRLCGFKAILLFCSLHAAITWREPSVLLWNQLPEMHQFMVSSQLYFFQHFWLLNCCNDFQYVFSFLRILLHVYLEKFPSSDDNLTFLIPFQWQTALNLWLHSDTHCNRIFSGFDFHACSCFLAFFQAFFRKSKTCSKTCFFQSFLGISSHV